MKLLVELFWRNCHISLTPPAKNIHIHTFCLCHHMLIAVSQCNLKYLVPISLSGLNQTKNHLVQQHFLEDASSGGNICQKELLGTPNELCHFGGEGKPCATTGGPPDIYLFLDGWSKKQELNKCPVTQVHSKITEHWIMLG